MPFSERSPPKWKNGRMPVQKISEVPTEMISFFSGASEPNEHNNEPENKALKLSLNTNYKMLPNDEAEFKQ
jgi:hypothetical protein